MFISSTSFIKTARLTSSQKHGAAAPGCPLYRTNVFYREEYLAPIPEEERVDMVKAYHSRLNSTDESIRLTAARAWSKWECVPLLPCHLWTFADHDGIGWPHRGCMLMRSPSKRRPRTIGQSLSAPSFSSALRLT
jgi:hypothetical protein